MHIESKYKNIETHCNNKKHQLALVVDREETTLENTQRDNPTTEGRGYDPELCGTQYNFQKKARQQHTFRSQIVKEKQKMLR